MKELTQKEIWYWLCNLPGIGYKKMTDLLSFYGSARAIYEAERKQDELILIGSLNKNDRVMLGRKVESEKIQADYQELVRRGISFYSIDDEEYPLRLKNIYDPPYGIYVLGRLPEEHSLTIGIVGARNCSNYGKEVASYFARHLAGAGVQIISGLARGIDGYGHEGALAANGYTLGILGSGVDYCYPKEHIDLYRMMEQKGGLLSEYGLGVVPKAGNFPRRNRLISAMCDGLLVVEAKERSGSLITVDQALEQGKDIFAVPGRICDILSGGTNHLIQMGAELVIQPSDILKYYQVNTSPEDYKVEQHRALEDMILNSAEKIIFGVLSLELKHVSEIAQESNLNIPILMDSLFSLVTKGYVVQPVKNYYSKSGRFSVFP